MSRAERTCFFFKSAIRFTDCIRDPLLTFREHCNSLQGEKQPDIELPL